MRHETHLIRTNSQHWKSLDKGLRMDILPVHYGFVVGDHILYQPRGDTDNRCIIKKKILKVESPKYPGPAGWVIITLDRSDKEKLRRATLIQAAALLISLTIILLIGYLY